jgi:hypothetical protein
MGVPTSEVGYISATAGKGDHEVHKEHVVALGEKKVISAYEPSAISRGFTKIMTHLPLLYLSEQWAIIRTIMSLTGCCCVSTVDDLDLRGVIPTFSPLIIDSTTAKQKKNT